MDLSAIARTLQKADTAPLAIRVLHHYNKPLTEKEAAQVTEFAKHQQEQLTAGLRVDEVPEDISAMSSRPLQALHPLMVIQCIVSAARIPSLPAVCQRNLHTSLLPLVAHLTPLSVSEWGNAMMLASQLPIAHSQASLHCLEAVLRWAAPDIFGASKSASVIKRGVPRKCTTQLKIKEFTLNEATEMFLKSLVAVVRQFARQHQTRRKHSLREQPTANECFTTSAPIRRLRSVLKHSCAHHREAWGSHLLKLCPEEVVTLSVLAPWPCPVSRDQLFATIKSAPGTLSVLLGDRRPVPGTLCLAQPADIFQFSLNQMALTTTTKEGLLDYLSVIAAGQLEDTVAYFSAHGKDAFVQLLVPFVNNTKVMTVAVAEELRDYYARLFAFLQLSSEAKDCAALVTVWLQAVVVTVTQKCRAVPEKAAVLLLACAMAERLSTDTIAALDREEVARMLDREVAIPSVQSSEHAIHLVRLLHVEEKVVDGLRGALRLAKKDTDIRRALLVHLSSECTPRAIVEEMIGELLAECWEVEVCRPDAFLALYFQASIDPYSIPKLCQLLTNADVLSQLGGTVAELHRMGEVAITLASLGQYGALAMLLTSPSGRLRRQLVRYVQSVASDAVTVIGMWDGVTKTVFGLEEKSSPTILSPTAEHAVGVVASALLEHTSKVVIRNVLAELLLCCSHDNVVGANRFFYCTDNPLYGRYRSSSHVVHDRLLERLVNTKLTPLLSHHNSFLMESLTNAMGLPEHVAHAACRAVVLLLSRLPRSESELAFQQLLLRLKDSAAYFIKLDARDRAIAAESAAAMDAYEETALREQQLLKNYSDRPPKGMSEEDYIDIRRKDAAALANGREALQKAVAQRSKELLPAVRQHKHPFLAIRLIGITGRFDLIGVAVLYPFLQSTLTHNRDDLPEVLETLSLCSIAGLLTHTPLGYLSEIMARTAARLANQRTLTVADVSQISTLSHALRLALPQMLPAPLFVVLLPFARVAFKAGRGSNTLSTTIPVATQHQIMSVLSQNLGQSDLPCPTEAMELLTDMLRGFPSLYKSVQQGVTTLMAMIPSERLPTLEASLFNSTDAVCEVTAAAFHRFAHLSTCRRALTLAEVLRHDSSPNISRCMGAIVADPAYNWHLQPTDWSDLLYFLKTYGQTRANALRVASVMKQLFANPETATEGQQEKWVEGVMSVGGLGGVLTLQQLSPTYMGQVPVRVMDYLCGLTEKPTTGEALMKVVLGAGRVVLADAGLDTLRGMAPELQARLSKSPKDATAQHKELYLATSTVWLTIFSCRLQETDMLESIIEQQSRTLNNSHSAMVHRCVCESMVEITKNSVVRQSPKLDDFMEKCLKQTIHSGSYIKKKAHAWGVAGVIQGLGLPALRRYHIMTLIYKSASEKQAERSGAMMMVEVLCDVLGAKFEPYALALSQILLEGVTDPDSKISECADDASRVMMSKLSGVGLRQLIPRLVEMLSAEQAKKRVAPLNFIGYVAFCSPKQLAATLPEIMKRVSSCLFDVNNTVSVAALNALRRVAGVVSNPEIQEQIEVILSAMRNPSTETEHALDALLYTRFVNLIDPASLALIIPVISRGLSGQMTNTRPKAAQIVASMVSLVGDAKALLPYVDELVQLLQEAAQDPHTEARTTSAKAIGALAAAIGGKLVEDVINWVFGVLQRIHTGTIEKAGAAQVFVEVVHACGDELLQTYLPTMKAGMTDEKPPVREGFLYIIVYAPSTLSSECFQSFMPVAFPWVLEGLSHFSDKVRDVALAAGDSIISLHGTRNLTFVLEPLLEGIVSEVTTLRHSSLHLAAKMLLHIIASIKKKMRIHKALENAADDVEREALANLIGEDGEAVAPASTETPDDADAEMTEKGAGEPVVLTMEAARDVEKRGGSILGALEEMLGTPHMVRLLSAIYCGRNEHNVNVRTDANLAWQASVASIRAAIGKIFDDLVRLLVHFSSSQNPDCVDVAVKTIEFTMRINETIERLVERLCDVYREDDSRSKLGSLVALSTVVQLVDSKRLMGMGGQIVGCVLPGMQEKDDTVQEAARVLFARVTKSVGPRFIEGAVEAQLSTSVRGVVEVVKVKPSVALALVFKHLRSQKEYTESNLELIDCILDVEEAEEEIVRYNSDIITTLLAMFVQGLEGTGEVMEKFIELCPREYEHMPIDYMQKSLRVPESRQGALLAAEAYGLGTHVHNVDGISFVFGAALDALGDDNDDIRSTSVRIIPQLIVSLEQRLIEELEEDERQDLTMSKRAAGRYLLQYLDVFQTKLSVTARAIISSESPTFSVLGDGEPRLFDSLMAFYYRGLDYGTPQQKVAAVECVQDLMAFAPASISAGAANTVAGRCSKVLFSRNDGSVVLALVRLCLQLMNYPASGKEKMVEGTMALSMFNAALCDSGEAREMVLRVVIQLLQRSEKYADLILGTVVTKKAAVDTPLLRTVMCRFISVVLRYANFTKAHPHIQKLMDTVYPIWEKTETPGQSTSAAVAIGALCSSESVTEETLSDVKERALAITSSKGTQAIGGFALVYALLTSAPGRTDQTFLDVAAQHLCAAAAFGAGDKLATLWLLRAAGAIAGTGCVSQEAFRVETYIPFLRRVAPTDEQMMSTAQYFYSNVIRCYPSCSSLLDGLNSDESCAWGTAGGFDADLDDELVADTVY